MPWPLYKGRVQFELVSADPRNAVLIIPFITFSLLFRKHGEDTEEGIDDRYCGDMAKEMLKE